MIGGLATVRRIIRSAGFDLVRYNPEVTYPSDFDAETITIIEAVRPYTMTSPIRIHALVAAISYIVDSGVPGDIVECGVWKGGSVMAAGLALNEQGEVGRDLYLFDTFEGMSGLSDADVRYDGVSARAIFTSPEPACCATLEEVQANMEKIDYTGGKIHFVEGRVEETIPHEAPDSIAMLRLDTDFYESTRHEMIHLFPRISDGGVLIIDDYGYWQGARKAIDEYFADNGLRPLLARIDDTARLLLVHPHMRVGTPNGRSSES